MQLNKDQWPVCLSMYVFEKASNAQIWAWYYPFFHCYLGYSDILSFHHRYLKIQCIHLYPEKHNNHKNRDDIRTLKCWFGISPKYGTQICTFLTKLWKDKEIWSSKFRYMLFANLYIKVYFGYIIFTSIFLANKAFQIAHYVPFKN